MHASAVASAIIALVAAGNGVLAGGPPAGCRQTSNQEWGGYCVCTQAVQTSSVQTFTTTVPVVTTTTSLLFGPTCFPPSPSQ